MRRIVENNIFSLLDTLKEDIGTYGNNEEVLGALAELKKESPMSQRIQVANKALPEYLKSDGINPLRLIYKTLSEGVHSLSDEKCLDKAVILQDCIKFLVGELSERKKHREKFKKSALRLGQSSSLC